MSRHFTYEIDERNLRVKLKDIEAPYKESAWEKFEAFSAAQNMRSADHGFKLKFSLNRNVVMLGIFGIVIISFSFLLFNFISIKNPNKAGTPNLEEHKAMAAEKIIEASQTVTMQAAAVPTVSAKKDTVVVTQKTIAQAKITVPEPVPAPVVEKKATPAVAEEKTEEKVKETPKAKVVVEKTEEELKAEVRKAEEFEKQRQKRAEAALAKKIKPTVVTEDTEPDVRPE